MFFAAHKTAARTAITLGLCALALAAIAPRGHADEQRVKRFGVALSIMPTSMALGDFNDVIDRVNTAGATQGLAPINKVHWSAAFGVEGRFMATKRWMVNDGFGRIKKESKLDLIPQVGTQILVTGNILTVPRNLGLDYYFPPKTSGDVTLRPFLGGGVLSLVQTKAKLGGAATVAGVTTGSFARPQGEGMWFYAEGGMHVMLPSKYSLLLNGYYRHAKLSNVVEETTLQRLRNADGSPFTLDLSGFGIRLGTQINFFGKPVK